MTGCTIRGRVTSTAGEPLRKAEVTLSRHDFEYSLVYVATTGADGEFRIDDVEPGQYRAEADRAGYVRSPFGGGPAMMGGIPLTIAADRALSDLDFVLMPQSLVTGRVVDEDGDPLENVRVNVVQEMRINGQPHLAGQRRGAVTDDRGEFRIWGVAPGSYLLSASAEERTRHVRGRLILQGRSETCPTTFYPDVTDPAEAQWVNVAMGAEMGGFELRMKPVAAYRVSGRVELPAGAEPHSVSVHIHPKMRSGVFATGGGSHGSAEFEFDGVLPGAYIVHANCAIECRSLQAWAEVEVVDRDLAGVTVRFAAGWTIPGHVRGSGRLGGTHISLSPLGGGPGPHATTTADGAFTLDNVTAGRYRVSIFQHERDAYVKTVRYDGIAVDLDAFDIVEAASMEVELASDSGIVAGVVQNAPGANIQLLRGPDLRYGALADQDGRFEIRGIKPGMYTAAAVKPPARASEGEGIPITVEPHARVELTLNLPA